MKFVRWFLLFVVTSFSFVWVACSPPTNESCQTSSDCLLRGLCTAQDNRCIATSQSCRASRLCLSLGLCSEVNGQCVATSSDDCRNSLRCKEQGKCIAFNFECITLSPAYCRAQPACNQEGLCDLDRQVFRCYASDPRDCEVSNVCKQQGRCLLSNGRCIRPEVNTPEQTPSEATTDAAEPSQDGADAGPDSSEPDEDGPESNTGNEPTVDKGPTGEPPNAACNDTKACQPGLSCLMGRCVPACNPEDNEFVARCGTSLCVTDESISGCLLHCDRDSRFSPFISCPTGYYCVPCDSLPTANRPACLRQYTTSGYCKPLPGDFKGDLTEGKPCSPDADADPTDRCDTSKGLTCVSTCRKACDPHRGITSNPLCPKGQGCEGFSSSYLGGYCTTKTGGATNRGEGEECVSNSNCQSGLQCKTERVTLRGTFCTPACKVTSDCLGPAPVTTPCNNGYCTVRPTSAKPGKSCTTDNDCSGTDKCLSHSYPADARYCRRTCNKNSDCPNGFQCNNSICVYPTLGKLNDVCSNNAPCGPGLACVPSGSEARCLQTCSPQTSNTCSVGQTCTTLQLVSSTGDARETLSFCQTTGTATAGQTCDAKTPCAKGLLCVTYASSLGGGLQSGVCHSSCTTSTNCAVGGQCFNKTFLTLAQYKGTAFKICTFGENQSCGGLDQLGASNICATGLVCVGFSPPGSLPGITAKAQCHSLCDSQQKCQGSRACIDGQSSAFPPSTTKICVQQQANPLGGDCDGVLKTCQAGSECGNGKCRKACKTAGSTTECSSGEYCLSDPVTFKLYCTPLGKEGDACGPTELCASTLACINNACSKTCNATTKAPCNTSTEGCVEVPSKKGTFACVPLIKKGDSCGPTQPCGANLACDSVTNKCVSSCNPSTGAPCNTRVVACDASTTNCTVSTQCISAQGASQGVCASTLRKDFEACGKTASDVCGKDLVCVSSSQPTPQKTCYRECNVSTGAPCQLFERCNVISSSPSVGICVFASGQKGDNCDILNGCEPQLSCVSGKCQ